MAGWEFSVRSSCSAGPSRMSAPRRMPSAASASANVPPAVRPDEGATHPHGLRTLTGKDKCQSHAMGLLDVSSVTSEAGALRPPAASSANPTKPVATVGWNTCKNACICGVHSLARAFDLSLRPGTQAHPGRYPTGGIPDVTAGQRSQGLLDPVVQAARDELGGAGLPGDRILVLRAIWRDLITGFAAQLSEQGLGFLQLITLYAVAGTGTLTVADLGEALGRSPSAASRIASGLERRGLLRRNEEVADRRQRLLTLTPQGGALLAVFDRARADQFLAVVRPLPMADRAMLGHGRGLPGHTGHDAIGSPYQGIGLTMAAWPHGRMAAWPLAAWPPGHDPRPATGPRPAPGGSNRRPPERGGHNEAAGVSDDAGREEDVT